LAGVVRELEAQPEIDRFLAGVHSKRSTRLRQAIGVLVRMIMERRGWQKTGKKGSLGVRATATRRTPAHNTGGLAFWFLRAERYERISGMPYRSVQARRAHYKPATPAKRRANGQTLKAGRRSRQFYGNSPRQSFPRIKRRDGQANET
jgi:hypothetical protein